MKFIRNSKKIIRFSNKLRIRLPFGVRTRTNIQRFETTDVWVRMDIRNSRNIEYSTVRRIIRINYADIFARAQLYWLSGVIRIWCCASLWLVLYSHLLMLCAFATRTEGTNQSWFGMRHVLYFYRISWRSPWTRPIIMYSLGKSSDKSEWVIFIGPFQPEGWKAWWYRRDQSSYRLRQLCPFCYKKVD